MKKIFIIAISLCLFNSSCKKDVDVEDVQGCTDPTATNYDSNATQDDGSCTFYNPTCDGHPTINDLVPLIDGAVWTYKQQSYNYTETINGTVTLGGETYYQIDLVAFNGGSTGVKYLRVDSNGDVIERGNNTGNEVLYMPANPTIGQSWSGLNSTTWEVTSLNASVTCQTCSYTGCVQITSPGIFAINRYYKSGIGFVKSTDYSLVSVVF